MYAIAAAVIYGIDRFNERRWQELEEAVRPPQPEATPKRKAVFQPTLSTDPYL